MPQKKPRLNRTQNSRHRTNRFRTLRVEQLESRKLLAAGLHNFHAPCDVNDDGSVTANDALVVINRLNHEFDKPAENELPDKPVFFDVNNDSIITAADALNVINTLNLEKEVPPKVELLLSARDFNDVLYEHDQDGVIDIEVGNPFMLEVGYEEFVSVRDPFFFNYDLVFQLLTDIKVNGSSAISPFLNETQQLFISHEIHKHASQVEGFQFYIESPVPDSALNNTQYFSPYASFARNPEREIEKALVSFGYGVSEFTVTDISDEAGNLIFQINWLGQQFGNVDLPKVSVEIIFSDINISIETNTTEIGPFESDGLTPNSKALRYNLDARSRSYNQTDENQFGDSLYSLFGNSTFDPNFGFTDIGGMVASYPELPILETGTVDAFSIPVVALRSDDNIEIEVGPSDSPEAILFASGDIPTPDEVLLESIDTNGNGTANLKIRSSQSPGGGAFSFLEDSTTISLDSGYAVVVVKRTEGASGEVLLNFETTDGTAKNGEHYFYTAGTLEFKDGERYKVIRVPVLQGNEYGGAKSFNLSLIDGYDGRSFTKSDHEVFILGENANSEPAGEELVELILTARGLDDKSLHDLSNPTIGMNVGEPFYLEVSYDILERNRYGATAGLLNLVSDVLLSDTSVLQPVFNETQRLIIDASVVTEFENGNVDSFEFSIPESPPGVTNGQLIHTVNAAGLAASPLFFLSDVLLSFGYSAEQFEVRLLDFGADGDVGFEIHWVGDEFGNLDLPNITLDVIEVNPSTDIPTQTIEYAPFLADGVTPNPDALEFNIDFRSRTSPDWRAGPYLSTGFGRSTYTQLPGAALTENGFEGVGGFNFSQPSGVAPTSLPFDVFSLKVALKAETDGVQVRVKPSDQPESVLSYDQSLPVTSEMVRLDKLDTNGNGVSEIYIKSANNPEVIAFQWDFFIPEYSADYVPVTVIRQGNADEATEVTITTQDGTAKAGEHYDEFSELVVFAPNERTKTIHIQSIDPFPSVARQFHVNLEYASSEGTVRRANALAFTGNPQFGVVNGPEDKLVELLLTARNLDDSLKPVNSDGLIEVEIDEPFFLEVAYDDIRFNSFGNISELGVFQLITDIAVSQPNVLMPILNETQRLIIDSSVITEFGNNNIQSFEFSIPEAPPGVTGGQLTYTSSAAEFGANPVFALTNALEAFGYSTGQFEVTSLPFDNDDIGFEIHWVGDQFGNVDLPNVAADVIEVNSATEVPTETIEYAPFLADGETPNPDAVRFNLNTYSRTFNPSILNPFGEQFYQLQNRGTFDSVSGFDEVGGLGKVPTGGGGIPDLTDDGLFVQPFDAFSLLVKITKPVDGFSVSVDLGEDVEALLLYGVDESISADRVYLEDEDTNLNGVSALKFITTDESTHAPGKIQGHVFIDEVENGINEILRGATPIRDGIKGVHEIGIGSRKILLESRSDENDSKRDIVLLQETNAMGEFSFENIPSGTYKVTHVEDGRFMSMKDSNTQIVTLSNTNSDILVHFPLLSRSDQLDILASNYF